MSKTEENRTSVLPVMYAIRGLLGSHEHNMFLTRWWHENSKLPWKGGIQDAEHPPKPKPDSVFDMDFSSPIRRIRR